MHQGTPRTRWPLLLLCLIAPAALAGEQVIVPEPSTTPAEPGATLSFAVGYSTAGPCNGALTGLGLRIHWSASQLELLSLANVLPAALVAEGPVEDDTEDLDGDPTTDKFLQVAWADIDAAWPGGGCDAVTLYTANFRAAADLAADTTVRFSASSTAAGYSLNATPALLALDSDGDGEPNATDAFPDDPAEWLDTDGDTVGDNRDNCPEVANLDQADSNQDNIGDACSEDGFCDQCLPSRGGWRAILR